MSKETKDKLIEEYEYLLHELQRYVPTTWHKDRVMASRTKVLSMLQRSKTNETNQNLC